MKNKWYSGGNAYFYYSEHFVFIIEPIGVQWRLRSHGYAFNADLNRILEEEGEPMEFDSVAEAKKAVEDASKFLKSKGMEV